MMVICHDRRRCVGLDAGHRSLRIGGEGRSIGAAFPQIANSYIPRWADPFRIDLNLLQAPVSPVKELEELRNRTTIFEPASEASWAGDAIEEREGRPIGQLGLPKWPPRLVEI
jgi:hypothetical protein